MTGFDDGVLLGFDDGIRVRFDGVRFDGGSF